MESALYDAALADILAQRLNWVQDEFCVALVQRAYKFSPSHTSLADIAAHVNGASDVLAGRVLKSREAFADATYVLALRGTYADQTVVYRKDTKASGMRLVAWARITPVQPVLGQRVDISWPDGRVFTL